MEKSRNGDFMHRLRVLYVEDEATIRDSLANILRRRTGEVITAENGAEGFILFEELNPDVVITDIRMPVMDGLEMCRKIREKRNTPIVITTGYNDEAYLLSAIELGVDSYVKKPVDFKKLEFALTRIAHNLLNERMIEEKNQYIANILDVYPGFIMIVDEDAKVCYLNRSFLDFMECESFEQFEKDYRTLEKFVIERELSFYKGKAFGKWVKEMIQHPELDYVIHMKGEGEMHEEDAGAYLARIKPVPGTNHHIVNFTDVTLIEIIRLLYHELAIKDPLTKVFNRKKFYEDLDVEIERARRYKHIISLIMLDIDHFKNVNDRFGHQEGDRILMEIVSLIRQTIRKNDVFARYGGEEFILFLPETTLEGSLLIAERLRDMIARNDFHLPQSITCSFGVATFEGESDVDAFIKKADDALYTAKKNGRNRVEAFAPVNQ